MSKVVFDANGNHIKQQIHDLDVKRKNHAPAGRSLADLYKNAGAPKGPKNTETPKPKFDVNTLKKSIGVEPEVKQKDNVVAEELNLDVANAATNETKAIEVEVNEPTVANATEVTEKVDTVVVKDNVAEEHTNETIADEVTTNEPAIAETIEVEEATTTEESESSSDSNNVAEDIVINELDLEATAVEEEKQPVEIDKLDLESVGVQSEKKEVNVTQQNADIKVDDSSVFKLETISLENVISELGVATDFVNAWLLKCASAANNAPGMILQNSKFDRLCVYTRRSDAKHGEIIFMIGFDGKFGLVRLSEKKGSIFDCSDQLSSDGVIVRGLGCVYVVAVDKKKLVV